MSKPLKILQASAGSGKTFNLAAHYLTLLFSNEHKYREILAVTFTNKATAEMKERILSVLKGLANGDQSSKIDSYRVLVLAAHPQLDTATLQAKADKIYRRILHDYSRFAVTTIDGFVQKVIRGFAFELGLNADYALEMNYDKVKQELVQKLDDSLSQNKNLLAWIIDLALDRIKDNKSWNYKTELLNLIGEVFKDSYEIFETSVNALEPDQRDELFRRYVRVTKEQIKDFEETFFNFCKHGREIIANYDLDKSCFQKQSNNPVFKFGASGFDKDLIEKAIKTFELIDDPDSWFKAGKGDINLYNELNPILKNLRTYYFEHLADYSLSIAFNKNLYYLRLMQEVAHLLEDYRKENGNLLISDAQKLITGITNPKDKDGNEISNENPSFIWEKTGARYRNFLFDEFQDTSVNQWKSFRAILSNAISSADRNLIEHLIVGDTKQSIYRWRNGNWNILHQQAKTEIGHQNVLDDSLEENYRSTQNIISFNNYLYKAMPLAIQNQLNANVAEKSEELNQWWFDNGYDSVVTSVYTNATQKESPGTIKGGTIKVKRFDKADAVEEVERFSETVFREIAIRDVISEIKTLTNEKLYQPKDIAILVRSNFEAMFCVNHLMEQSIPVLSGEALMIANNSAVQLILNTLKAMVGVQSETAIYKANCIALYHRLHQKELDPVDYINLTNISLGNLSSQLPASLCENFQNWMHLPLVELVENLMSAYELTELKKHTSYLLAFRDLVALATSLGEKGIINFLTWWDEEGQQKTLPSPEEADAIQIITIHKSKGLAFRAVFVPFAMWELETKANSIFWVSAAETMYKELGGIPLKFAKDLSNSRISKAYFKEVLDSNLDSLNMLYVATTRAKDFLYLSVMGKKESEKSTTVGDILTEALSTLTQGEDEPFNKSKRYELVDDVIIPATEAVNSTFELEHYPTTNRLSALYVPSQEKHLQHVLNIEASGRLGSIKHEVLAKASTESDVRQQLENMLMEGTLSADELPQIKDEVMEVLEHPELKSILEKSTSSIIEQNIIDANGKLHRPDRILIHDDSVTLLDYKFTVGQSDKHIEQILTYRDLLTQMGFEKIKSYLYYANDRELKEV